ncbi:MULTISPECIES: rhodanese-like domain-containing protein [unclassified Salinibacterium]|uniref:rhodanese-like domain-containing protein n=1 Tax=unclassified Salinibacterium TaxID=2632331 RepID=UPI001423EEE5|nr:MULTISPECIES: rhodanese-like domain-containing protein [unclassified Salinibacterium]
MNEITVTDLAALGPAATIIDVREQNEYQAARVEGVTLIPLSEFQERIGELPADETLYIMCASGARSARVAQYLEQNGIDAVNVVGGIQAWHAEGLPVTVGTAA